jgi:hypothetical protein
MGQKTVKTFIVILLTATVLSLTAGCALNISPRGTVTQEPEPDFPSKVQTAELVPVAFFVDLRQSYSPETVLALNVLDEVTGLDFNITRYELSQISENKYSATLCCPWVQW